MDDETRTTQLALDAGQGDRDAAAAFVRATQQQVWRFVAHLAGPAEADDLTQETYVRALRSLPRFAARSSALTWLFVIARRVVVDHRRSAAARPRLTTLDEWPAAADARALPIEDGVVLRHLLAALTPERRDALVATQVLGLSYAEAAKVCDCPIGTIRSRVARARDDLIAAMADTTDRERRPG
ncbi:sigma-70 family RNA polymerase sigma factor [Phytohabitans suffuscus]|uniref:RNA polymerase sigma factor n=1 Tax=Phytohabitans suffuscus TaxID=624315 RepID=A0A6F8YXB8_9ACTN|nr:sigma-70 family RNA polymerase sigma factor [Phytohabitans suffuscus]BCB90694.1 RNA polymerase sigma factor [Phytohabitans suffuscus]